MSENISITCPISSKDFECKKEDGIPYVTRDSKEAKPRNIYFSPYSEVGIAYPILEDEKINSIYTDGKYWRDSRERVFTEKTSPGLYALALSRWRTVKSFLNQSTVSVLDIGAGHGYFGMSIAKDGDVSLAKYHVVEKDPIYRRSIKRTWDLRFPGVHSLVNEKLEAFHELYDLIVLSHVLEHLNHPKDLLNKAAGLLKKDGYVFIDVPHQDFQFKGDVYPHVLFYNTKSLKQLAENAGLEVMLVQCYGKDMNQSPLNWKNEKSLASLASKVVYKTRIIWPEFVLTRYYSRYFGSQEKNDNGTWIRLIAKKKEGH